jgi:hypothetical protein
MFSEMINHIPATAARHLQIDDGRIKYVLSHRLDCSGRGLADRGHVAKAGQFRAHQLCDGRVVIDEQDAKAVAFASIQGRLRGIGGPASSRGSWRCG